MKQRQDAVPEEDMSAIRRTVADAQRYQVDVEPFVALHTGDAIIVNIAGRRVAGRDRLHEAMKAALGTSLARVLTRTEIEDIRFATPDVAIVSCIKHVSDERETPLGTDPGRDLPTNGRLTYVMVREHDAWRIASAQTTPILES